MQGIQEISQWQPTVISPEDLKALLYLTIRGENGLTPQMEAPASAEDRVVDAEKGVDVRA